MNDFNIDIQIVDSKQVIADTAVDYVPFGVKTLKLQIRKTAGPAQKVWIRTKHFQRDQDPCNLYGLADDGDDLWAIWGAGDIMGFCAKYAEQLGTKKAVALDDNEPHTVYLHLIHRPEDPIHHQPRDRQITIVAVTSEAPDGLSGQACAERHYQDTLVTEKTFTLTVPAGITNPVRPIWDWQPESSHITFSGDEVLRYTSRWWPARQVEYARAVDRPRVTLDYARSANDNHESKITVWLEQDSERVCLAEVAGHLTLPVYDLRWFVPELYRFYDDQLYVLRLWFFWTDEHLDAGDLLAFVPNDQRDRLREQRAKEAAALMQPGLGGLWLGWAKQYEIPDVERFDLVFDPRDLSIKYGCTDAHWKEFWFSVNRGQPCQCRISAPKDAVSIALQAIAQHFEMIGKKEPQPITNPLEEGGLVSLITNNRCAYDGETQQIVSAIEGASKAAGIFGRNAPRVENTKMLTDGLSSDVLAG